MIGGFCLHDELMLMVKGGMSPAAALQTATINPARALALENIANVRRIHAVVIHGRVLDRARLDATLANVGKQFQTRTK